MFGDLIPVTWVERPRVLETGPHSASEGPGQGSLCARHSSLA